MPIAVLIDIGSATTKAVAVDLHTPAIVGRASEPTTHEDVSRGVRTTLAKLTNTAGYSDADVSLGLACSSAGGPLRLAVVGLTTATVADMASRLVMGSGALAVLAHPGPLSPDVLATLERQRPDAVLLAGATDVGGVSASARALAASKLRPSVVLACTTDAASAAYDVLDAKGFATYVTEDLLPEPGKLNLDPAQQIVRDLVSEHLVRAPGMDYASALVDEQVTPTPSAVLEAARLLTEGSEGEPGLGELVVVDAGASMTAVYSVTTYHPAPGYFPRGVPEPYAKRTLDADLAAPAAPASAADVAMGRHAGYVELAGQKGTTKYVHGKDLRPVRTFIGTGGALAAVDSPHAALARGLWREDTPLSLRPTSPDLFLDGDCTFGMLSLLGRAHPAIAVRLLKAALTRI